MSDLIPSIKQTPATTLMIHALKKDKVSRMSFPGKSTLVVHSISDTITFLRRINLYGLEPLQEVS